jgi:hypothetical protein
LCIYVGYAITLLISRLNSIDDKSSKEFEGFGGMRIGKGNRKIMRRPALVPLFNYHESHRITFGTPLGEAGGKPPNSCITSKCK